MSTSRERIPEGLYPMRAVARFTGLSPDVVRIWERRYGAVEPDRTAGRARRYSAREVRRLLMLHELTRRGHSIGDVARLSDERLEALLDRDSVLGEPVPEAPVAPASGDAARGRVVAEYLGAMGRFDVRRAQDVLAAAAALLPPRTFVFDVAIPILQEVGERWSRNELGIAHEHVVSSHVKGFLASLLRMVPPPPPGAPRLVAGTIRGQQHEFGAMMAAYLAAVHGWDALYAGPDLPPEDLSMAADLVRADVVVVSVIRVPTAKELPALVADLKALARRVTLWVGAPPGHPVHGRLPSVRLFDRLDVLTDALDERRRLLASPTPSDLPPND